MEANELRIGNYVKFTTEDKSFVSQIYQFNDGLTKVTSGTYSASIGYPYKGVSVEPIPITEEILLKCGFEENYRSKTRVNYDHKDFMFIGYDINLSGIDNAATGLRYYGSHIKVNYLHDLQNAFKVLTGQELIYTP